MKKIYLIFIIKKIIINNFLLKRWKLKYLNFKFNYNI